MQLAPAPYALVDLHLDHLSPPEVVGSCCVGVRVRVMFRVRGRAGPCEAAYG